MLLPYIDTTFFIRLEGDKNERIKTVIKTDYVLKPTAAVESFSHFTPLKRVDSFMMAVSE